MYLFKICPVHGYMNIVCGYVNLYQISEISFNFYYCILFFELNLNIVELVSSDCKFSDFLIMTLTYHICVLFALMTNKTKSVLK